MGPLEWLLAAGVALVLGAWAVLALRCRSATGKTVAGAQVRRIRVNEGYEPSEIHAKAGLPIRLVFRREESASCSEQVVFPDLGISAGLRPFQDVIVDMPAIAPGTHRFCCEMDMIHGRLIVEPDGNLTPSEPPN